MTLDIRPERPDDYDAIARVVAAAFGRALEAELVARIRASDRYVPELALVAVEDGAVAGHTMFSYATLVAGEGEERDVLQLSPVAVAPERQRDGIGGALIREGIAIATERREPLVVVLGHAEYYPRFGFEPCRRHGIEPPHPAMEPNFFVLPLPGHDARLRGRVVFPPAFDGTRHPALSVSFSRICATPSDSTWRQDALGEQNRRHAAFSSRHRI